MPDETITVYDPLIIRVDYDANSITFVTQGGEKITLNSETVVEGYGEHYFAGTIADISLSDSEIGTEHHWVTFENVTLGETEVAEHTLPLGELAAQIDDGGISITN